MADIPEPVFQVNAYSEPVVLKILGRVSYLNALPINDFFRRMEKLDKRNFILDFAKCTSVDSTFLGIVVGAALTVRNLGLHRIATVDAGDFPMEYESPGQCLKATKNGEIENAKLVLQAHENLIEIDEKNKSRFQDVVAYLKNQID
jgi:anti-sigma B factor antagonist